MMNSPTFQVVPLLHQPPCTVLGIRNEESDSKWGSWGVVEIFISARSSLCLSLQMAFNDCFSLNYPGNPQPGDLIEVFRPGYQHWALYLGDGYVINIAPLVRMAVEFTGLGRYSLLTRILFIDDGISASFTSAKSVFSRKALVKMQLLKDVVGNDTYRINNKYDETYPPLPVEEVMQRSEFVAGQEVEYDLFVNNCEHFVTLLRYGEGVSGQVSFL
ncbi:hypothetical protein J1605_008294 [Eschrichtius robustus]|uniref:LRAT domain-containing protein n=1 Tax=Eschrichtius robustus TaxID=9764 RepID=A0AB34H0P3_ESCRO|nr:hypothetical protein J1605_008294 [Eschrichtius robustus]